MPDVVPSDVVKFIHLVFPLRDTEGVSISNSTINHVATLLELVDHVPDRLLLLNSQDFAAFVGARSTIRSEITSYRNLGQSLRDVNSRQAVKLELLEAFGRRNAITIIMDELSKCPDQMPKPSASELAFIQDETYRNSLRLDLSTIATALAHDEWKAATVLSGSVIEALLLWALECRHTDLPPAITVVGKRSNKRLRDANDLAEWDLYQYILIANELKIVTEHTAALANAVRNFRNLIHPGRTVRLGERCTRGTAQAAYGAVELVVEDLAKQHP